MKQKIYFGHPIDTYGTAQEDDLLTKISENFPQFEIENPNQPHHDAGYKKFRKETGRGMNYFFQDVLPQMDAGVFLPFEDGKFGAGVYVEAEFLCDANKPIYEISPDGSITDLFLNKNRFLSIEETRARVYSERNK